MALGQLGPGGKGAQVIHPDFSNFNFNRHTDWPLCQKCRTFHVYVVLKFSLKIEPTEGMLEMIPFLTCLKLNKISNVILSLLGKDRTFW